MLLKYELYNVTSNNVKIHIFGYSENNIKMYSQTMSKRQWMIDIKYSGWRGIQGTADNKLLEMLHKRTSSASEAGSPITERTQKYNRKLT